MPGIIPNKPTSTTSESSNVNAVHRFNDFLEQNKDCQRFTVDDDNHGMGLVVAHYGGHIKAEAMPITRGELCHFMTMQGFEHAGSAQTAIVFTRVKESP